jgi:hypothetical protein
MNAEPRGMGRVRVPFPFALGHCVIAMAETLGLVRAQEL